MRALINFTDGTLTLRVVDLNNSDLLLGVITGLLPITGGEITMELRCSVCGRLARDCWKYAATVCSVLDLREDQPQASPFQQAGANVIERGRARVAAQMVGMDCCGSRDARHHRPECTSMVPSQEPLRTSEPPSWPGSITAEDELRHPQWPDINEAGDQAPGCENIRSEYNRTRCANAGCWRCWRGGPLNWKASR